MFNCPLLTDGQTVVSKPVVDLQKTSQHTTQGMGGTCRTGGETAWER